MANSSSIVLPVVLKSCAKIWYGIVSLASPETRSTEMLSSSFCQPSDVQVKLVKPQEISLYSHTPGFASALLLPCDDRYSARFSVSASTSISDSVTVIWMVLVVLPLSIAIVSVPGSFALYVYECSVLSTVCVDTAVPLTLIVISAVKDAGLYTINGIAMDAYCGCVVLLNELVMITVLFSGST